MFFTDSRPLASLGGGDLAGGREDTNSMQNFVSVLTDIGGILRLEDLP